MMNDQIGYICEPTPHHTTERAKVLRTGTLNSKHGMVAFRVFCGHCICDRKFQIPIYSVVCGISSGLSARNLFVNFLEQFFLIVQDVLFIVEYFTIQWISLLFSQYEIQTRGSIKPLEPWQHQIWKSIMEHVVKDVNHPNMALMFEIVYDEATNDEIAVSTRLMDRVKQFFHLMFPHGRLQIQTINNIDEARDYLSGELETGPTLSYYNDVVLEIFELHNLGMKPIYRVGLFVACYAYSKMLSLESTWKRKPNIDSIINAVVKSMQKHLSQGRDGYLAFLADVEAYVKRKMSRSQLPSVGNVWRKLVSFKSV